MWEVDRAAEFSPLKNGLGAGKDCPETCRKSILDRHASWAKAAGALIVNEQQDIIEISPLVSLAGEVNVVPHYILTQNDKANHHLLVDLKARNLIRFFC